MDNFWAQFVVFEVLLVLGLNFDLFLIVSIHFFLQNCDSDTRKTLTRTIGAGTTSSGWWWTSHSSTVPLKV